MPQRHKRDKIMPKPQGMAAWLVEDAYISDDDLLKMIDSIPREEAEIFRDRISKGGKQSALVWLVTVGSKRVWCAFVGGTPDLKVTRVGQLTLNALARLPGVSPNATVNLSYIRDASRFEPMVGRVLMGAQDGSLVCFLGDVAGVLDGLIFPYMDPMGQVKAGVEVDAAGWPRQWRPLRPQ